MEINIEEICRTRRDPVRAIARIYCQQPHNKLSFREVCRRVRDLLTKDKPFEDHGEAWGVSKPTASRFAKNIGFKRRLPELRKERENLATQLYWMILQRSAKEDPAFCIAYNAYMTKKSHQLPFEQTYARVRDLFNLKSYSACAERWEITPRSVSHFARSLGFPKKREGRYFANKKL